MRSRELEVALVEGAGRVLGTLAQDSAWMMKQLSWTLTALVITLAGVFLAFWVFGVGPVQKHRVWSNRIAARLDSLRERCPADLDPDTWDDVVGWTTNLHVNCG